MKDRRMINKVIKYLQAREMYLDNMIKNYLKQDRFECAEELISKRDELYRVMDEVFKIKGKKEKNNE